MKLCIERYWDVVGGLSIGATPDSITLHPTCLPQNGDPKTLSSHNGQTVADGATLWTDRHCEGIIVANSHYVFRLKNLSNTSAALAPQFVGFSCGPWRKLYDSLRDHFTASQCVLNNVVYWHLAELWQGTSWSSVWRLSWVGEIREWSHSLAHSPNPWVPINSYFPISAVSRFRCQTKSPCRWKTETPLREKVISKWPTSGYFINNCLIITEAEANQTKLMNIS